MIFNYKIHLNILWQWFNQMINKRFNIISILWFIDFIFEVIFLFHWFVINKSDKILQNELYIMIINDLLDFQSQFFKIFSIKSKIFDDDFEIMMNNLNLKHNLRIDNIFCKNKHKRNFLFFSEYFETFIDLFILFI